MHTIPSLPFQNPIRLPSLLLSMFIVPPSCSVSVSFSLSPLPPFRKCPSSSPFLRPSLSPHMGLWSSFLQSQASGPKTMSRLRALGVLHQRCRRQLSPCPLIGPQPISPRNVSAQGNSPGCPCRRPDIQILQDWWPISLALSLCKKSTRQASLGRGF